MSSPGHDEPEEGNVTESESHSPYEPSSPSELVPRIVSNGRAQALEEIRLSIPNESIEAYTKLLAESARDNDGGQDGDEDNYKAITQDGIVMWTPQERRIFFQALDRKGRDGIKDIAKAIGSKSELEVQEYLQLLHKGLQRQHFNATHTRTVILGDIPAATELSTDCCEALDQCAQVLSLEEQVAEDIDGRKRHKDMWIIDSEVAERVEAQLKVGKENLETGSSVVSAAELFNMGKWTRLSERFFMNFGGLRLDDNWVNVALEDETPAVTADAFGDFYSLVLSLTQRLVQSAIWFAMSRIQLKESSGRSRHKVVKYQDVRTALDVLNMDKDSFHFWIHLARRCSLDVADIRHRKGWEPVELGHDEVERSLSRRIRLETEDKNGAGESLMTRSSSQSWNGVEAQKIVDDESDSEYHEASLLSQGGDSDSDYKDTEDQDEEERNLPSNPEDDHAEALDRQTSHMEELQYWATLERPAPDGLTSEIESIQGQDQDARKPKGERKSIQELTNWRDQILYRSEWEEYGPDTVDLYADLSRNRRKRRRLQYNFSTTTNVAASPEYSIPDAESLHGDGELPSVPGSPMDLDDRSSNQDVEEAISEYSDVNLDSPEPVSEAGNLADSDDDDDHDQERDEGEYDSLSKLS